MTNEAPKRVNILPEYAKTLPTAEGRYIKGVWYVLEDHAQAELQAAVAAEREACAEVVESLWAFRSCQEVADAIRARGDTDALAERDARVKAEGLREAANRNALTVRSIKEAIDLRDYDAAREIAMKGNAALSALIPDQHKVDG